MPQLLPQPCVACFELAALDSVHEARGVVTSSATWSATLEALDLKPPTQVKSFPVMHGRDPTLTTLWP